jgi:hypothetical protein
MSPASASYVMAGTLQRGLLLYDNLDIGFVDRFNRPIPLRAEVTVVMQPVSM